MNATQTQRLDHVYERKLAALEVSTKWVLHQAIWISVNDSRRPGRQPSRGDRSLRHRNRLRAIPSTPRPQGRQARERSRTAFHEPVIAYTTRFASAYYSPASAKSRFALEIPPWISMTVPVTNALAGDAR